VVYRLSALAAVDAPQVVAADAGHDDRGQDWVLQRLFRRPIATLAIHVGAALLCWSAVAWLSGQAGVLGWALGLHASQALQAGLVLAFRRRADSPAPALRWLHRYLAALGVCALAWGSAPWWVPLDPHAPASWVLIAGLLVVAGAGANVVAVRRSAIVLWLLPVLGPLAWTLLRQSLPLAQAMGGAVCAFMLLIWLLADQQRRLLDRSRRADLDNAALVTALRSQVALVEQANRDKSRFLAAASHDLRQPMHALGLFAATLQRQLGESPMKPTVTHMMRSIDALDQSFNAMLDVSRLDAGVVEPNLQSFPIRDLFRVLHMQCNGQAEQLGLSLRFKPGGKIVTSDPQLLQRVLGNLIHNAVRYTPRGGIVVLARSRHSGTSIEVWDTGIGIAEPELPRVFDEFYQVGNPGRDRSSGLGMGLAIVKRLVLLMGHQLELGSRPGRGTVFKVLIKPTELSDLQNVVLGAETVPTELGAERSVLLIDDEHSILVGMSELLAGWGYRVLTATTIDEACSAVRRHADVIHIVVSDLRLAHGEDGIDAVERVRAVYGAPLPALLITGDTSADEVKRAHASGHQVLFKPVRTRELYAALRAAP
jgi:signal transduction histidine kinase/CheY-like chemotaxis protein